AATAAIFGGSSAPVVNMAWGRVHFNPGAAGSSLVINGEAGDDTIKIDASFPAGATAIKLNGNDGDDTLIGTSGNDTLDGGAGDDTFIGNGGTDAIGGGLGSSVGDTIALPGTSGNDTFSLALDANGHLIATVNGLTTTYTNFIGGPIGSSGIEQILVQ